MAEEVGRCRGTRCRHAVMTSDSSPGRPDRSGSSVASRASTSITEAPWYGGCPVAANSSVAPSEYTSLATDASRVSLACSGAMYAGVPTAPRAVVRPIRSAARATPKSITRGPSGATSTLEGLRSRCTSPAPWIEASASAHPAASQRTVVTGSGPQASTSRASDGAGTYAVASQGRSASGSASTTAAVNTPLTFLAAATSCANRVRKPASSASSTLIVLTATSRPAAERPR